MPATRSINPFAPEHRDDPYPAYAALRAEAPLLYHEGLGFWLATRHAVVHKIQSDPAGFSSARGIGALKSEIQRPTLLTRDPPDHTRLRSLVSKAFTPRRVAALEPRITSLVDDLLDEALAPGRGGAFDLVEGLARPLPLAVMGDILSVEPARRDDFTRWSDDVIRSIAGLGDRESRMRGRQSYLEFDAYFSRKIEERRTERRTDLLSALVTAQEEQDALSTSEILNFCMLLFVAGNETTTNLITNAALALFGHPETAERLRADPSLIERAVEEVLRYDSPVQGIFRTTAGEVSLAGVTVPADQKVCLLLGSANRDPEAFPDADSFDIERTPNPHVALGHGIHYCIGAPLARIEARVALASLLRRTSSLHPDPASPPRRLDTPMVRGMQRLPVLAATA